VKRLILESIINFSPFSKYKENKISFIIPTIWKSSMLEELIERLSKSDYAGEIIIIDNKGENGRNLIKYKKVKVYNSPENLFVNPSWNKGAELATYKKIAICNDDILFDTRYLAQISKALDKNIGIIGVDRSCLEYSGRESLWLRYTADRRFPYGILMFMNKDKYVNIPEELKIYSGDNYLFEYIRRPHFAIKGIKIITQMSSSSGSEEFKLIKMNDMKIYKEKYKK